MACGKPRSSSWAESPAAVILCYMTLYCNICFSAGVPTSLQATEGSLRTVNGDSSWRSNWYRTGDQCMFTVERMSLEVGHRISFQKCLLMVMTLLTSWVTLGSKRNKEEAHCHPHSYHGGQGLTWRRARLTHSSSGFLAQGQFRHSKGMASTDRCL